MLKNRKAHIIWYLQNKIFSKICYKTYKYICIYQIMCVYLCTINHLKIDKMNGFGKDLQEATITTKLYRKVGFGNLTNFGELCCSTSNSSELSSHGELCLVFAEKEYTGYYADGDADAGKTFGYDEFRVELDSIDADWLVYPDSLENDQEFDFDVFIDLGFAAISETEYKKRFNGKIKFNF